MTKKLNEIWHGEDINKVRELHVSDNLEKVPVNIWKQFIFITFFSGFIRFSYMRSN